MPNANPLMVVTEVGWVFRRDADFTIKLPDDRDIKPADLEPGMDTKNYGKILRLAHLAEIPDACEQTHGDGPVYIAPFWIYTGKVIRHKVTGESRVVRSVRGGESAERTIVRLIDEETGLSDYIPCSVVEDSWEATGRHRSITRIVP